MTREILEIFLEKAKLCSPKIIKKDLAPTAVVEAVENEKFYQDTEITTGLPKEYYMPKDKICLDFGKHITGFLSFNLGQYGKYIAAPVKLYIKFAETPYEMKSDFSKYDGLLCSSWLQEEIITVDIKGRVSLPRRYSFRYVEIKIIAANVPVTLSNFTATACSSADFSKITPLREDGELKKIDEVAINTLAECMQDVFEDGPKRDRRLWIGDLRLEALANYYTFKNIDIVKRCLYLFAAFDSETELLPSYIYTNPYLETDDAHLVSYALLYVVTLCDYFDHTNDIDTVSELFEVARHQIEITKTMLDENGILTMPENYGWWSFIDWCDVEPITSTMGIYIYSVKAFSMLCEKLGRIEECEKYKVFAEKLKKQSLKYLYNGSCFNNEYDKNQYSVHSQIWMILADVVCQTDAKRILKECLGNEKYMQPSTPYMHHYVVEALIKSNMTEEATAYIKDYWGEMIRLGADTFWEVFVKGEPYLSPYKDSLINSSCHAWSCTPTYFIRKYKLNQ